MGHHILLVTAINPGTTSLDVRRHVYDTLMADDSFVEPSISRALLFYQPIADYILVGGSWSGLLVGKEDEGDRCEDELGTENDALLITPGLYRTFLAQYEGLSVKNDELPEFVDLDDEPVDESFIGRKWLCVTDFHS